MVIQKEVFMWNNSILKKLSLITVLLFAWFCLSPNYLFSEQTEDELEQARRLFQQGYYDDAITLLNNYIEKIRSVAEQKRNVAQAFYQLAKVYFTVGEDDKVEANLRKVFETYPDFQTEEADVVFNDRVEKFKQDTGITTRPDLDKPVGEERISDYDETGKKVADEEGRPEPEKKVISQPVPKKKKKKFPWLLVIGGVVVAGVLAYFLLFNKKEESKVTDVTIQMEMNFAATNLGCRHIIRVNGIERFNEFLEFNVPGYDDYDLAKKINRTINVTVPPGNVVIEHEIAADYNKYFPSQNSWIWATDFLLNIVGYNFQGDDPGSPILSQMSFHTTVAPWVNDPSDEWYRIESKTISIITPTSALSAGKAKSHSGIDRDIRFQKTRESRK